MIQRLKVSSPALVTLLALATVVCQAQSRELMTRHVRDAVVNGQAAIVGHLPRSQTLRLVLVLPQRNTQELDRLVEDVSDPASPRYRQYLTVGEFTERFGPAREDYEAVKDFARSNGFTIVGTSRNRTNLDVVGTVDTIERALHVTLGFYKHPTENRVFYAPDREPTPDTPVRLWRISGLDNYSIPRPALKRRDTSTEEVISNATTGSCPSSSFCGSDMRAAYYGGTALTGAGQTVGLFEFVGTDLADLTTYYKNTKQTNNVPVHLVSVDGTSTSCVAAQGCDDTEQTLDMTQALGMAPGMAGLTMYVGSSDAALLNGMATASPLDNSLSCSWSWRPPDPTTDDPYFRQLAVQGQTFFVAAGDSGDWQEGSPFWWPADNQYVVSVGGTDLTTASAGGPWKSEIAWSDGGGGISPTPVAIPSWQVKTAASCASCSQTERNAPDVAANANFTFYVCADQTTCTANLYGGTSFAAPMWAGYVALLNQAEARGGHKPVGFIDPALYSLGLSASYSKDFNDITTGSNGYSAGKGYDLATGWGSPKAGGLIK
jgi:subtilase family serine protease